MPESLPTCHSKQSVYLRAGYAGLPKAAPSADNPGTGEFGRAKNEEGHGLPMPLQRIAFPPFPAFLQ